jgi:predicted component of viral defense system (DUF524 family)
LIENHQQSKEQKDDEDKEEEKETSKKRLMQYKLKSYHDALKTSISRIFTNAK